jgi:hypothetical protein
MKKAEKAVVRQNSVGVVRGRVRGEKDSDSGRESVSFTSRLRRRHFRSPPAASMMRCGRPRVVRRGAAVDCSGKAAMRLRCPALHSDDGDRRLRDRDDGSGGCSRDRSVIRRHAVAGHRHRRQLRDLQLRRCAAPPAASSRAAGRDGPVLLVDGDCTSGVTRRVASDSIAITSLAVAGDSSIRMCGLLVCDEGATAA